jgi:glycosyltransferase involved in cell wall biosynthesis
MQPPPRVSVVLPVHNEEQHLEQAIESILQQTETNFELIVVDDGSTDGSPGILARLARGDSRILPIRQPHGGIVAALNRGLADAHGAIIARMDADDVAHPERLRLQADFLDRHPATGLVASRVEYLGDKHGNRGLALFVEWTNSLLDPADIARYRFVESPFIHPSVMFRREIPGRFGGYRDGPFPEDYELWLRWLERGVKVAKLPETLLQWRERPERLTRTDPRYGVEAFYRTKAPFLYRWLERKNPYHPDVVVWGSGRTSRQRLRYLTDLGVRVSAFIDIDPRKLGYKIGGAPVLPPDGLPPPGECFVLSWVGSRGARAEIEGELAAKGYRIEADYMPCA